MVSYAIHSVCVLYVYCVCVCACVCVLCTGKMVSYAIHSIWAKHAQQLQRAMHLLTPLCALCQETEEDSRLWPLETELHVCVCVGVCVCVCVCVWVSV